VTSRGHGSAREEAARWWSRMRGPDAEGFRDAFEAWRRSDSRNDAQYAALERTWELAAGLGTTQVGRSRTMAPVPRRLGWATAPRIAVGAAAAAAMVLLVILWPADTVTRSITAVAHATAVGEIRTFALPDGSSVTLDTDSRLQIAFDDKVRKVKLDHGRARFDLLADPNRTFVVEAGGKTLSAHDGAFDVRSTGQELCVSTLRGLLDVRPRPAALDTPAQLRLAAGQAVRFGAAGAPLAPSGPAGKGSERWVSGMLVYQGAPLSAVLEDTNRYSRRRIVLGEPGLKALRVTGAFKPLPVDQLAASLAAAFDLQVQDDRQGSLILTHR
jgi:transmembrane sensor